ncbi:MAG: flagellar brake protein [Betaproteobacteria bacterium]|nr:flagellar brake protein [Betaproteobacteria bacterium]
MSDQIDNKFLVSLQEDELEEFLLRGRHQIRQLLRELINSRSLVSVHLLPGGLSFLSTIIMLSGGEDWIFLDTSSNETIYRRSLQAERLLCVTQLNKIRIQFRLSNFMEVSAEGHPTLAAPVPDEILRLQRRDAFRLQIPLFHNLKCILPAQENEHSHEQSQKNRKKSSEVPVIDISAGGLSIEIPLSKTAPVVGDQIAGCYLKLSGSLIGVDLEIRNYGRRILGNGKEVLRLGCSFVSLPIQIANQIQRYIYQIERELRAHEI